MKINQPPLKTATGKKKNVEASGREPFEIGFEEDLEMEMTF